MQVSGSEFGRTGTLSLKSALEMLGFKHCYHMMEVMRHPSHVKVWLAAADGEPVDWESLFAGFEAAADFPSSVYYKEMMQAFPEAKVLHSVRDPQRWYESTLETIYQADKLPAWAMRWLPFVGPMSRMINKAIWDGLFSGKFKERDFAIKFFDEYTQDVIRSVPAERLLIFDVKQGWEPLCEFLDVPVPDVPFPHLNDRKTMGRMLGLLRMARWLAPAAVIGMIGTTIWLLAG